MSPYLDWSTAAANIQDAVDVADAGDLILVTDGVYQTGGRVVFGSMTNRVAVTKPVKVQSVKGPAFTTIKGYQMPDAYLGWGSNAIRCVYLTNGAWLVGFTVTGGATRTTGDQNKEMSGGGVWGELGLYRPIVSNCVIMANSALQYGGGLFGADCYNCVLFTNIANFGGGVWGNVSYVYNSLIISNIANSVGGGSRRRVHLQQHDRR